MIHSYPGVLSPATQYPQLTRIFQRLNAADHLTICYFGGSITWGAAATDPLKTSYRALLTRYLEEVYPQSHITTVDAAIGGIGSQLGVFRMDRDVLPYHPDLTVVEFAVNDGDFAETQETMEGIIRKLKTSNPEMAIVIITIGAGWNYQVTPASAPQQTLAAHYGLPVIDVGTAVQALVAQGLDAKNVLEDGCHPNDDGYHLYTSIMIKELERLKEAHGPAVTEWPDPLTCNRYETAAMLELAKLPTLDDWQRAYPSLAGTWFDHTPSRWFSSVIAPQKDDARVHCSLECRGLGLYYEISRDGQPLHLLADGMPVLDIETSMPFDFARVAYTFVMGDESTMRSITLLADRKEYTKVAYVLYTR